VDPTFPIAGQFMDTSDPSHGLSGHVFNGHDENHINSDLRQALAKHTLKQARLAQQPA
jgi:hypothetical protein